MLQVEKVVVSDEAYASSVRKILEGEITAKSWSSPPKDEAYASWEWAVPAAVALLIAKSMLDGFFKEFGSAAGKATLNSLKSLVVYIRNEIRPRIYSSEDLRKILDARKRLGDEQGGLETLDVGKKASLLSMRVLYKDSGLDASVDLIFDADSDGGSVELGLDQIRNLDSVISKMLELKCKNLLNSGFSKGNVNIKIIFKASEEGWFVVEGRELTALSKT